MAHESGRTHFAAAAVVAALTSVVACGERGPRRESPAEAPKAPTSHERMVALLSQIRDRTPDDNPYQGDGAERRLAAELAALPADAPPLRRFTVLTQLGEAEVSGGREREGVAHLEESRALLPRVEAELPRGWREELLLKVGTAWLRVGETENCCANRAPESCILPLAGAAIHTRTEGSRRAIEALDELLDRPGADEAARLQAMWVRNLAAMTLGEWPEGVPEDRRIPASAFAPDEPFPRFENVAARTGLDVEGLAGSVVVDDLDGDGDLDVLASDSSTSAHLRLFRNEGDGTFAERTREAGIAGLLGGLNMIQADFDADGAVDVLVLRGGWFGAAGRHPNSLLRNRGDGTFEDVTFDSGLGGSRFPSQTAVWFDYDLDGRIDLYVGNETTDELTSPCQLFRNEGGGRFTERGAAAGVVNLRFTKSVVSADFDGDRLPDLYVSNLRDRNRLYRNRGDGTFEDVAERAGVDGPLGSFPAFAWDPDDDGDADLLVFGYDANLEDLAGFARGGPLRASLPQLYLGDGRGGFRRAGPESGLVRPNLPMAANFGDLDADGRLDFYLGTGTPFARDLTPNLLFRGVDGTRFADVTVPSGTGHLQKGHGIAFADLDDDGDLDVLANLGGGVPVDRFRTALFENPGFGNRWLAVRLEGRRSNRSAIGARIRAEIEVGGETRSVHRTVGSGGSFGANPLRQFLGLGRASVVRVLEVTWPATGATQTFRDVPVDRLVEIVEDEPAYASRTLRPVRLGGGRR